MVSLTALWLPIVLSAVAVFIASSVIHMALKYHNSEYQQLPDEDAVLGAMRNGKIGPGFYSFPYAASMKEMGTPEMMEKYKQGPVGTANINPSGPPAMGKHHRTTDRNFLRQRQLNVTGAWRQINHQVIQTFPVGLGQQLLQS